MSSVMIQGRCGVCNNERPIFRVSGRCRQCYDRKYYKEDKSKQIREDKYETLRVINGVLKGLDLLKSAEVMSICKFNAWTEDLFGMMEKVTMGAILDQEEAGASSEDRSVTIRALPAEPEIPTLQEIEDQQQEIDERAAERQRKLIEEQKLWEEEQRRKNEEGNGKTRTSVEDRFPYPVKKESSET